MCKVAMDPLYDAVYEALATTSQPLLDVGCGMGLCAFYLRECGLNVPMRGLDFDASKIAVATIVAAQCAPDIVFETSDARGGLPQHAGSVTILDILQYLALDAQGELLSAAAQRVSIGGKLVIRTSIEAPGWRFALSKAVDRAAAALSWMKASPVVYPRPETIRRVLEANGLHGTIRPLWGHTPFNNWLAVFERT